MPGVRYTEPVEIDPLVRKLTPARVRKHIRQYLALLDNHSKEERVHEFLANHSYFFNFLLRLNGTSPLYSKIRLGSQFQVDFACFDTGSSGPEWYLIEIESPARKIFIKSGNPSAALNHAMQQVRDWLSWVHENLHYARKLMPYIEYPLGYIFIGRRNQLDQSARSRLKRLNYENRVSLRLHSLDWFVDSAKFVLNCLGRDGYGSWLLPMKALTHEDLRRGLPPDAQSYLRNFVPILVRARRYPKEMIEDREHDVWPYGEAI